MMVNYLQVNWPVALKCHSFIDAMSDYPVQVTVRVLYVCSGHSLLVPTWPSEAPRP